MIRGLKHRGQGLGQHRVELRGPDGARDVALNELAKDVARLSWRPDALDHLQVCTQDGPRLQRAEAELDHLRQLLQRHR
jgi:hypothetical protein